MNALTNSQALARMEAERLPRDEARVRAPGRVSLDPARLAVAVTLVGWAALWTAMALSWVSGGQL